MVVITFKMLKDILQSLQRTRLCMSTSQCVRVVAMSQTFMQREHTNSVSHYNVLSTQRGLHRVQKVTKKTYSVLQRIRLSGYWKPSSIFVTHQAVVQAVAMSPTGRGALSSVVVFSPTKP